MAEWLRRQTRNLLGSARAGSNPADYAFLISFSSFISLDIHYFHIELTHTQLPSRSGSIQGAVTLELSDAEDKNLDISIGQI